MTDWLRLGDVITIQRGTTYKSALLDQPGPVLLGLASIERNGGFRRRSLRTYGGESPPQLLVRPGGLFASLKDVTQSADLLGSVARVPAHSPIGRLTQDTVRLDLISQEINADYLYWCLRTPQYRQYCRSHATGTTNLGLPRDDFLAFQIPRPTAERLAVISALVALDDLVDSLDDTCRQLDELERALFLSCWDGATRLPVGTLGRLVMGQSPPGTTYNEAGPGLPFYQGVRDFGARHPSRRVYCTSPTRIAQKRDILIAVRAPIGDTNVAIEECAIGRGLAALNANRPSSALQALRCDAGLWQKFQSEGTVFAAINKQTLESNTVPWVDDRSLEAALASMDTLYQQCWDEAAQLRRQRDELLPLLLSEQVRIEEVAS